MAALKIIFSHMTAEFSVKQAFAAKEPFGPLSHSNQSHYLSAQHKCVPKKENVFISRPLATNRVSPHSMNAKRKISQNIYTIKRKSIGLYVSGTVCFNSSETARGASIKLGTIDHHLEMSVIKRFVTLY